MIWETKLINELYKIKGGKRLPKGTLLQASLNNHPYIRITDMVEGRVIELTNKFMYVPLNVAASISSYKVQKDDLILSIVGQIGNINIIGKTLDEANLTENCVKFIPFNDNIDTAFIYYYLSSEQGQEQIEQRIVGSTQPKLPIYNIQTIEIPFPPLIEQKAIASVLSCLDDKIALLHRQSKTLEEMAETLFYQWFIEIAKKEEWKQGVLEHLVDLKYGKALKQEDRSGSGYPVVASSGIVGFHKDYLVEGPGIVIGRKGTLGKVYFMEDSFYPIDTSYFIKTKIPRSNMIFEYYLLKSLDFVNMNSDSAVPGLNRNIALGTAIQIPPLERVYDFNRLVKPWLCKIQKNTKQIKTLEKLRDTLLPKLMSGEVRVEYKKVDAA
ncbi:restriction endonuclease subunit S [Acinetobacter baumannii]